MRGSVTLRVDCKCDRNDRLGRWVKINPFVAGCDRVENDEGLRYVAFLNSFYRDDLLELCKISSAIHIQSKRELFLV